PHQRPGLPRPRRSHRAVRGLAPGRCRRQGRSLGPGRARRADRRVVRRARDALLRLRDPPSRRMKIDAFTHILPRAYHERLSRLEVNERTANRLKRASTVPALLDLDERFRQMDEFGDYRQVINMAGAPVHDVGSPALSRELAHLANESLAELV